MDAESETNVAFGSIFDNRISTNNDSESVLLDYSKPQYAASFSNYTDCKISPLIQPYDNSMQSLKFSIGGIEDPLYTDLSTLRCVGRLQVQTADGEALSENEPLSVVNLFPESIFSQINVYLNSLPVSDHGRGTNLKAYIQKHYSCSQEVKNVNLKNNFYFEDECSYANVPKEEISEQSLLEEEGHKNRSKIIKKSRDVKFIFKPTFDLMTSEQALPPTYILGLEFERALESFSLLTFGGNPQRYKIRLFDFHLEVRRFLPSKSALQRLPSPRTGTHFMSFTRQTVRYRAIHQGVSEYTVPQVSFFHRKSLLITNLNFRFLMGLAFFRTTSWFLLSPMIKHLHHRRIHLSSGLISSQNTTCC